MHAHRTNVYGQCSCRGKINDLPSTGTIQSAATLYVLRGERGSLSLASKVEQKHTNGGGGRGKGRGVGRGEGTRVRVWRSIYFQAACVPRQECVRYDFRSFSSFFDRVRWLESTSRAIRHGLAGLSSCSIRSSSMFSSSSSSSSFVLHCWQLYTSYRTTILGCSYFRCGQTLRSLASEPNRFISDLSLGLRNNSRKSIPTNES